MRWCILSFPTLEKQRQVDLCEFMGGCGKKRNENILKKRHAQTSPVINLTSRAVFYLNLGCALLSKQLCRTI